MIPERPVTVETVETLATPETAEHVETVETVEPTETVRMYKLDISVTQLLSDNLKARDASAKFIAYIRKF